MLLFVFVFQTLEFVIIFFFWHEIRQVGILLVFKGDKVNIFVGFYFKSCCRIIAKFVVIFEECGKIFLRLCLAFRIFRG